ncbi:glycosyltransferase [Paenibacillus sp. GD4]|uniref:glycosyltransferase n=1 Tax=Paenibacillus sp. GD4 TaxID=3068890 RepID=UPI0027964B3C|nr:glycosyltransferase [Paenibacillus sp. GD4]MDQ1912296.1 glycosyltransferase [Paenibacillus sp. GD4]
MALVLTVIVCTMRPSFIDNVFDNYLRQTWEEKELMIILNRDNMDITEWRERAKGNPDIVVYQLPQEYTLGKCLNWGIARANYPIIAKFDDDDYYGPDYLKESMHAMKKKKAPIIGKTTCYLYFEAEKALMLYRKGMENQYRPKIKGGTLLFKKSVWEKVKFPEKRVAGSDARWLLNCNKAGFKVYSVSKNNYVCIRREDISTHTQKKNNRKYMESCKMISCTSEFVPLITKAYK